MSTLAEHFAASRPKAKYSLGDRVEGVFKKIPWVGTVGNDSMINEEEGPLVGVHLDLPLKAEDTIYHHIRVKYKDLKLRS
jgi:hypothetical protein